MIVVLLLFGMLLLLASATPLGPFIYMLFLDRRPFQSKRRQHRSLAHHVKPIRPQSALLHEIRQSVYAAAARLPIFSGVTPEPANAGIPTA